MKTKDWLGEQITEVLKWAKKHPMDAVIYLVMIYIGITLLKSVL